MYGRDMSGNDSQRGMSVRSRRLQGTRRRAEARLRMETLEERKVMDVALANLSAVDMATGKDQLIALTGSDTGNLPISYTAQSSNANVTASVVTGGQSWKLNISGVDGNNQAFTGDVIIRLFEDLAPTATQRIIGLTTSGFYNGLTFHRVINNFMIQGGDPNGNGSGGSPLPDFSDEYVRQNTFTSRGVLASANSGDDTNNSQFFIVDNDIPLSGMPQHLNFNHTIFGLVTAGQDIYSKAISTTTTGNNGNPANRPITNVVINTASIITDTAHGVLRVSSAAGFTGSSTITVTATNGQSGALNTVQKSVTLNVAADIDGNGQPINDRPFLGPITNQSTNEDTQLTFTVNATDLENDNLTFVVRDASNFANQPANVAATVTVTPASGNTPALATIKLTPNSNFFGTVNLIVGVRDQTLRDGNASLSAQSNFDTQKITFTVNNVNDRPTMGGQTLQTALNTPKNVTLTANDGDPTETQTLTYEVVTQPNNGAISNFDAAAGTFTYTPNNGFSGPDTVVVRVKDNGGTANGGVDTSLNASIIINVNAPTPPTGIDLPTTSDDGLFNDDNYITTGTPTINVTAEAGLVVKFFVNDSDTGITATEVTAGNYRVTLPANTLIVGDNTVVARAIRNNSDSDDSTTLTITYAPKLGQVYQLPGAIGEEQSITNSLLAANASLKNEIGYFVVDDATGKVGALSPGQAGWAQAALALTSRVTLVSNTGTTSEADITADGGQFVVFYIIANGTSQQFLTSNPTNTRAGAQHAFFSIHAANPDGKKHVNAVGDASTGDAVLSFEDLWGGGDADFNDAVLSISATLTTDTSVAEYIATPASAGKTAKLKAELKPTGQTTSPATMGGEFGFFSVEDIDGTINNLSPGENGYLAAALNSASKKVLFTNGQAIGASSTVDAPGGGRLVFYYIPGGTSATVLATNPNNTSSGTPKLFMSFDSGNPDDAEHFRWFGAEGVETSLNLDATATDEVLMHVMDQLNGVDTDFDDYAVKLSFSAS